ncbi:LLM class flavin-dependent oxidoreductase [Janthinobacterium sp. 17J80-10]|uniref:LLM class flavin-dependent oxidoreductase n=1 Tax=Janthinobacterium sp. 17J80-10 TaxID=2497863 RepID=UPI0010057EF8|nr:LLM class flavin-dependent oxidoreductase [Janthinobacterium sp. 17J80-10]QAU33988.1 LLM class flavin-dependent oxidoreductase [Janthinobacterium sp. 17J80-10]
MTVEFIWQLPTSGDGRLANAEATRRGERTSSTRPPFTPGVSDPRGASFNYFDYLHQVARAADLSGFNGVQIRHDLQGDESWIVAGYLARSTRHLKLVTEFEAAWGSAVYAAKNAVSFQRFTGGRLAWQISAGSELQQRRQQGDFVSAPDVPARIDEFLTVAHGVQTAAPFNFKGRFFEVQDGGFKGPLAGNPPPAIYLSGDTDEAYRLSAKHADVHLLDAAPVDALAPAIADLHRLAAETGRILTIGLRIDVLARETEDEAFHDAHRYLRQSGYQPGTADPVVGQNLWEGLSTGRTGARSAIVGSYEQVTQRLEEYVQAGIGSFVLAAIPSLEEAYRIGEHVLPQLRERIANGAKKAA